MPEQFEEITLDPLFYGRAVVIVQHYAGRWQAIVRYIDDEARASTEAFRAALADPEPSHRRRERQLLAQRRRSQRRTNRWGRP